MAQSLAELRAQCADCTRCGLHKTRTNLVFGRGPEDARIMLVGEAPGRNEDLQGQPFVGAAGKTLDGVLAAAGIAAEDVYIANVLKCRPPHNRDPELEEIAACTPLLDAQMAIVNPDVIVCLGRFAATYVLGQNTAETSITAMRGRIWRVNGRYVVPVYHPAATIYDKSKLPVLVSDLKGVRRLAQRAASERNERERP